jgi:uncharacterized protein (TIGR00255 family)
MIRSMTGYGKAVAEIPGRKLTVEVKSLNSKQTDVNARIPNFLREKELEIRNMATQVLERGKIDIYISVELSAEASPVSLNRELAVRYHKELKDLQKELREDCPGGLLPVILKMPDVMQQEKEEIAPTDWGVILSAVEHAVRRADDFRLKEGAILESDINKRIGLITGFLSAVEPFEEKRVEALRGNLVKAFEKYGQGENGLKADPNRLEQELVYYLEKLDFTEEKVRLKKHCDHFLEVMNDESSQGKKLGFITQEIGREINTLGSKANDADIQKLVVQMKDELEKVKEQLMNIL